MIGRSIAHYAITDKIGEGGMGEVYRAHDTKLNRAVALKILPQVFASDSQPVARFEREAQVPSKAWGAVACINWIPDKI